MSYTSVDYNGTYANPDNQYADLKKYNTVFGPKPRSQPNQSRPTLLQQPNPFGYDALSHGNGDAYYDVKSGYGTNCDQKYYTGMCPSNRRVGPFPPRMKENYNMYDTNPAHCSDVASLKNGCLMNGINCIETKAGSNPHLPTLYTTNGLPQYCYLGANPCNLTVGENRCPDTCWRKCCAGIPDMPAYDPSKENYDSDEFVLSGCDANINFQCVPSSQGKSIEYDEVKYQTQSECMSEPQRRCLDDPNFAQSICPNYKDDSCVASVLNNPRAYFLTNNVTRDQLVAQCCHNSK